MILWWVKRMVTGQSERGATAVEYAIILAAIAGVVIATVKLLGEDVLVLWGINW